MDLLTRGVAISRAVLSTPVGGTGVRAARDATLLCRTAGSVTAGIAAVFAAIVLAPNVALYSFLHVEGVGLD